MPFTSVLLQAAPAAGAPGGMSPGVMNILFIGLLIVVFYFFMIRPQKKKQDEQGKFLSNIAKGDKVATVGGVVGKVSEIRSKTFIIDIEGGGKLQVLRSAISFENTKSISADAEEKKD